VELLELYVIQNYHNGSWEVRQVNGPDTSTVLDAFSRKADAMAYADELNTPLPTYEVEEISAIVAMDRGYITDAEYMAWRRHVEGKQS